jgi:hypothetical protein
VRRPVDQTPLHRCYLLRRWISGLPVIDGQRAMLDGAFLAATVAEIEAAASRPVPLPDLRYPAGRQKAAAHLAAVTGLHPAKALRRLEAWRDGRTVLAPQLRGASRRLGWDLRWVRMGR